MSEPHSSLFRTENKNDVSLPASQSHHHLPNIPQSTLAPLSSSHSNPPGAPASEKTLAFAQEALVIGNGDVKASDNIETEELIMNSREWKGKGKSTVADHARWDQEAITPIAGLPSSTPTRSFSTGTHIGTYNSKSQIGNTEIDSIMHGASEVDKELPSNVWNSIWKLVANENPRNVDIWAWSFGYRIFWDSPHNQTSSDPWQHGDADQWEPFRFMTTQLVPPILHVNFRSRAIGLQYYKLGFGVSIPTPVGEYKIEPRIYYHVHNDCLCPMGRFDYDSVDCFWESLPEGTPTIALNLCSILYSDKESEEESNEIPRDEFGDED